jgi:phage nucleotide-binding protein
MNITKATDLTTDNATYLIYANPGVGKTSALKHLPGKTLVIDIDKSSGVLKGAENIDIAYIDTHNIWKEWMETVKELVKTPDTDYDNIVIDNVSELFRATLANLGREGKNHRVPEQSHYQRVDFTILDSLRALKKLNARIVFTAWETSDLWEAENGQSFNRAYPDMRNKILNNFMGLCDVVARLVIKKDDDGNETRGFILQPSAGVYAKNRLDGRKGCVVDELVVMSDD